MTIQSGIETQGEGSRIRLRGAGSQGHANTRMQSATTGVHKNESGAQNNTTHGASEAHRVTRNAGDAQAGLDRALSTGTTGPAASYPASGTANSSRGAHSAGSLAGKSTAETKTTRKRTRPPGVQGTSSSSKRRIPGILATALDWAR